MSGNIEWAFIARLDPGAEDVSCRQPVDLE
jgi:hypothetical protein